MWWWTGDGLIWIDEDVPPTCGHEDCSRTVYYHCEDCGEWLCQLHAWNGNSVGRLVPDPCWLCPACWDAAWDRSIFPLPEQSDNLLWMKAGF